MQIAINITVKDSIFNPRETGQNNPALTAKYYTEGESTVYKVWIYLEGAERDLFYVDYVIYHLHPTFPNPVVRVDRTPSNPTCILEIETWGMFVVTAEIYNKAGAVITVEHPLTYDQEIRNSSASQFMKIK